MIFQNFKTTIANRGEVTAAKHESIVIKWRRRQRGTTFHWRKLRPRQQVSFTGQGSWTSEGMPSVVFP